MNEELIESLIGRLRAGTGGGKHWMELHEEAANEIAYLRDENERLALHIKHIGNDALRSEIQHLRAQLAEIEKTALIDADIARATATGAAAWAGVDPQTLRTGVLPQPELSDDEILTIAHRKATRYTHVVPDGSHWPVTYGFSVAHMLDFARAIEKAWTKS